MLGHLHRAGLMPSGWLCRLAIGETRSCWSEQVFLIVRSA
jgi:hypothetical protein